MTLYRLPALAISIAVLGLTPSFARDLSFEERVDAQQAIERVHYAHQIGATRPFAEAVPREILEHRVKTDLKQTRALEAFWGVHVTGDMLRREVERMATGTRMPDRLRELFGALANDPWLIQECLARPMLASRLAHNFFAFDERIHAEVRRQAEEVRSALAFGRLDPAADHPARRVMELEPAELGRWRDRGLSVVTDEREAYVVRVVLEERPDRAVVASYTFPKRTWDDWWEEVSVALDESAESAVADEAASLPEIPTGPEESCSAEGIWDNGSLDDLLDPRVNHTAVWTGSVMIVWGGSNSSVVFASGARYDPATDTWTPTSALGAPAAREQHTAVWTGDRMIIWGGRAKSGPLPIAGGRYDPVTDTWLSTSTLAAPAARFLHSAVWTGNQMIVWGGGGSVSQLATGGRYDPVTDTWLSTSTVGAPAARYGHTAVWTGSRMIVWGGDDSAPGYLNTGGRYDPVADTWLATSTVGAPSARIRHTAVWTGSRMVVWGGNASIDVTLNTGARYDPVGDSWTPTSGSAAPQARTDHTAVWTGSQMIVWGGADLFYDEEVYTIPLSTGGRYDPVADTWVATSPTNAPLQRFDHVAVWTGAAMVVWGGGTYGGHLNTGGRYDPVTNTWTPTSANGAPETHALHTAVWTGSLMIVWGGRSNTGGGLDVNSGGRYDPATDSWMPTATFGAPTAREAHTAVWSGERMIVWGGWNSDAPSTGSRYDPIADTWLPTSTLGAPSDRGAHTSVWTGTRMIVWGGYKIGTGATNTGGRYDPVTDSWLPTSTVGAPSAREEHTAVWTGARMIVWGGDSFPELNTGGRYDPVTDSWAQTAIAGAPEGRYRHTAVWTGDRMVVWGGFGTGYLKTGGRYDPVTNSWLPTSTVGAPAARLDHTAVWTGELMIVWGGQVLGAGNSGGRYDPASDSWATTSQTLAPIARYWHTAVWTGDSMIVWGGDSGGELNTGGRYDPGLDSDCDGALNHEDCALLDPGAFSSPAEVANFRAASKLTWIWDSAAEEAGPATVHDVAKGSIAALPVDSGVDESCAASGTAQASSDQSQVPAPGSGSWFLVRGRNVCGSGTYGYASNGSEHVTAVCP